VDTSFSLWLLRESQELTQQQLAKRIRRPRQLVSDWEVGQLPTVESLRRLSRGLRVPVSVILLLAEARERSKLPA
jgi:transcriptional regulator with XRE-family HTH domain